MSTPPPEWMLGDWPMSVWSVVVAACGVVASTAVAIAAFTASYRANKIAIQNREDSDSDGRRHERREFYEVSMKWLEVQKPNLVSHGVAYYPHDLSRLANLIRSDTAHKLVKWMYDGARIVAAQETSSTPDRKATFAAFLQTWGDQCALWVKDAEKNHKWPPFTLPAAPTTP